MFASINDFHGGEKPWAGCGYESITAASCCQLSIVFSVQSQAQVPMFLEGAGPVARGLAARLYPQSANFSFLLKLVNFRFNT